MESHYAKADKKVQDDRKRRTLLLKNGDIAVVYLHGGKGAQIGFRFFDDFEENMAELPFSKIYWISGVYSVKRENGRIVASVKCLEYMMIHPYVNEYNNGDSVEHCFRYYTRKVRRTIRWSDKLLNADKLLDALQALEKTKVISTCYHCTYPLGSGFVLSFLYYIDYIEANLTQLSQIHDRVKGFTKLFVIFLTLIVLFYIRVKGKRASFPIILTY